MLIWKSTHDAVIAAKDAEIAGLMKRLDMACDRADQNARSSTMTALLAADRAKEIRRLEAQLARYTAPRERGEGGRFLPLKQVLPC